MHSNIIVGRNRLASLNMYWLTVVLLVCSTTVWAGTLQGNAFYRERIALPPDAVFEAELQDISRADAPAIVLGHVKQDPAGQPPFNFDITYNDAAVQKGHRYAVRASIKQQGRLLFTTDKHYPVLDGNNAPLSLMLVSVPKNSGPKPANSDVGQLPASFEGELPGASNPIKWHVDLLPEGRYQLRTIHIGQPEPNQFDDIGRWAFETDSGRIVLRGGRDAPVYLMPVDRGKALRKLDLAGKPIESSHNEDLTRLPVFTPIEPRLKLSGMFSTMADAASMTLCADGQMLPVAMEVDYKALEAAYRQAEISPGQPILASIEGLITQRPSMEESQPARATLVVERFIKVWPRETCGTPEADSPLQNTYWKLVRLGDTPVAAAMKQREAHLVFANDSLRVSGSGGCNRLSGGVEINGNKIQFGNIAGTMMACPAGMTQEMEFLNMLKQVQSYRIRGSHLEFLSDSDAVLARFEAVALK